MKRRFWLPVLLMMVFLGGTVRAALHHHADGRDHPECQVCLFQQATANGDAGSVQLVVLSIPEFAAPEYVDAVCVQFILAFPTPARSPPAFS